MAQKFFEIIPPGTRFPFVRTAKYFIGLSFVLFIVSIATMAYNYTTRGSALNFGIDFAGGSSIRLQLAADKDVPIQEVREALDKAGFEGASAVTVPDADNQIMIHVKDVASIDMATAGACEEAVKAYPKAKLKRPMSYQDGTSKMFFVFDSPPVYSELEELLAKAGCEGKVDKGTGKQDEYPVELSLVGIGAKVQEEINKAFGAGTVKSIVSSETVGAKVGSQLKADGVKSLLYALGFIFLYVMLRFDLRFAPGGIIALAHDAFLTVGAFALTWKEFNLQTIAALLTIVGYSINDTIVVFDRIRERVALSRDTPIDETTDIALNETLSRTILTSGTTLLVVLATWALGSGTIKDFAFALMIGIVVGTYSSLFIACPIFLWVNRRFYGGEGHLLNAEAAAEPVDAGTVLAAENAEIDEATGRAIGDLRAEAAAKAEAQERVNESEGAKGQGVGSEDGDEPAKASRRRRRQRPSS
ncbi:protein translocase subunit SecF [Nannocystis radixulma]|uniref:Protein-export membrane protein SecF n=1 Tax=Nannocystis radixulma TaxID=2995305 RepID=A0ABT5BBL5_9BACT|nr:protein translocase subunit SecF [Nannocystis radixulma]MDC0671516.1 protein translocase subunit SecF [Nannocystis radixulma]